MVCPFCGELKNQTVSSGQCEFLSKNEESELMDRLDRFEATDPEAPKYPWGHLSDSAGR